MEQLNALKAEAFDLLSERERINSQIQQRLEQIYAQIREIQSQPAAGDDKEEH